MKAQARRQLLQRPRTTPLLHLTQAAEPDVFDSLASANAGTSLQML